MAGTCQSARLSQRGSSPGMPEDNSPTSKTIEQTMREEENEGQPEDIEMEEATAEGEGTDKKVEIETKEERAGGDLGLGWLLLCLVLSIVVLLLLLLHSLIGILSHSLLKGHEAAQNGSAKSKMEDKEDTKTQEKDGKTEEAPKPASNTGDPITKSSDRAKSVPSAILEKGIIYFFTRGRVGIEEPESVSDLQRTYFVLHPLPAGSKISDGSIKDANNSRLFALPKKMFPKKHSDRFMAFVEKSRTSILEMKEQFFKGNEYQTQTTGTRVQPAIMPIGEGVYTITKTEKGTHLAYMLTIPNEPGEVQEELGLQSKGSFHMSVKNPERPGPSNARLNKQPEYPKEILQEFRGLAWVDVRPKYLDYNNVQILLIGEGTDDTVGRALDPLKRDEKQDKETPAEEMEKLEHEDELRVQHLNGDDSVFDDLKISSKDYPKVPTTW